jgi:GAF domain-containing protein
VVRQLEAAACLPLLVDDVAVGYLAAHYRGPHHVDQAELLLLRVASAARTRAVSRLRASWPTTETRTTRPCEALGRAATAWRRPRRAR